MSVPDQQVQQNNNIFTMGTVEFDKGKHTLGLNAGKEEDINGSAERDAGALGSLKEGCIRS